MDTPMQVLKDRFAMLKSRLPKNTTDIALNTCEPSYREIAGFCASGETYINKGGDTPNPLKRMGFC